MVMIAGDRRRLTDTGSETAGLRRHGGDPLIGQDCEMEWLTDVGLGLENDTLRLDRTSQAWIDAGRRLRNDVAGRLGGSVIGVEPIGSSSVLTLLAKPIVDIAVGLGNEHELSAVRDRLEATGWTFRATQEPTAAMSSCSRPSRGVASRRALRAPTKVANHSSSVRKTWVSLPVVGDRRQPRVSKDRIGHDT